MQANNASATAQASEITEATNQEATGENAMNKVAENIAELNRQTLDDGRSVGEGISALAQAVKRRHGQFARNELGMAVYDAFHKGGIKPMEDAWERIIEHLETEHKAYGYALLAHPRVSNQQVRQLQMSPIVLSVGEARTLQPMESFEALRATLRAESGLRERLYAEGQDAYFANAAREHWAEMPASLKAAVFRLLADPAFAEATKVARVNGESVKAFAVKGVEALEKPDASAWWAARAGTQVAYRLFQLSFRWANSAAFWADIIRPTAPWEKDQDASPDDEVYPGEEVKPYEGPFSTFTPGGSTLGELHDDRLKCMDAVQAEFEEAAELAEAFMAKFQLSAAEVGIETPFAFIRNEDGSFTPITDMDEALGMLQAKEEQRAMRRVKMEGGGQTFNNRNEAQQAMLEKITDPAVRQQVEAELNRAKGVEA